MTRYIGIDPGQSTGMAVCDGGEIKELRTVTMLAAMRRVAELAAEGDIVLRIEDPRQYTAFGSRANMASRRYGAGYVIAQRDAWEEFAAHIGVAVQWIAPRNNITKLSASQFKRISGHDGHASVHARDAAMLVVGASRKAGGEDAYLGAYRGVDVA